MPNNTNVLNQLYQHIQRWGDDDYNFPPKVWAREEQRSLDLAKQLQQQLDDEQLKRRLIEHVKQHENMNSSIKVVIGNAKPNLDDWSFVDLLQKLTDHYLERACPSCPLNPTHSSSPSVQALQAGDSRRFTDGQQHERSHEAQSGLTRQQRGGRGQGRLDRGGRGSGNQRDGSFSAYSEPHAVTSDTFPAGFASNPRSGGRYSQDTARSDGRTGPPSPPRGRSNAASFDDRRRLHYETRDGQPVCHQFLLKGQCSFGNQCRYAHALRDIFQIEKRPFDGLDMVPEFSGRRSSHDQDRHTSDRRANFQGHMTILAVRFAGKRNLLMTTTADQRFRFRERQRIGRSSS